MTLRGYPFLVTRPGLCDIFGISRWTLAERLEKKSYPLLKWINDSGKMKVTRPSVERQLESMMVRGSAT